MRSTRPTLRTALGAACTAVILVGCAQQTVAQASDEAISSEQATFRVVPVVTGLEHPWGMAFLPGGGILITERAGRLRMVRDGVLEPEPIEGVPEVYASGQGGLLDVALDPGFASNRVIYLSYAASGEDGNSTRVARATLGEGPLEDLKVIFMAEPLASSSKHFGSRLAFDAQGHLFITVGERRQGDRAQDLGEDNGKVIRLNTDGSVPEGNPFVGVAGARPEIFSYGHRNPQGLAIHPQTGTPWLHEHGAQGGDEVNVVRPGVNYGWPVITYGIDYSGAPIGEGTHKEGMAQPIHYWVPSIAPSGMAFYDGAAFPEWQDDLFVGGLRAELLVRLELDGERVVAEERLLDGALGRIRDVEVGPDDFLYLLTDNGDDGLYRLEPAGSAAASTTE
jgi:glucose/arabinose dehydrogenase